MAKEIFLHKIVPCNYRFSASICYTDDMNDFKQQLQTAYDQDAKRRDANESDREGWKLNVREEFAHLLKSENKKTILELGAGAGIDSKYFMGKGFDVLATDLSSEMVKMCEKRGVKATIADVYSLDKIGQTFDGIFSLNVLLHVPRKDLQQVLDNIHNTLNNNGIFFYGVYGGRDEEKVITDKSRVDLPRFFSFLSDESLLKIAQEKFEILSFTPIHLDKSRPGFHFQSLVLRK
jgi:2-polyprenyl-3-methyl-5-hydroxy-6-metoxy-1,4-benzoquinol methylase